MNKSEIVQLFESVVVPLIPVDWNYGDGERHREARHARSPNLCTMR